MFFSAEILKVHDKLAIKLQMNPGWNLFDEGAKMTYLSGATLPEHIVRLLVNPPTRLTPAMVAAEGIPNAWLVGGAAAGGFVRRLVMEYLPLGSL